MTDKDFLALDVALRCELVRSATALCLEAIKPEHGPLGLGGVFEAGRDFLLREFRAAKPEPNAPDEPTMWDVSRARREVHCVTKDDGDRTYYCKTQEAADMVKANDVLAKIVVVGGAE